MNTAERYVLDLSFREALGLFLTLRKREEDLDGAQRAVLEKLEAQLYDRLSIDELEQAESLYHNLKEKRT